MIAAIPPLLVWFGLFLYLLRVDGKVKQVETRLRALERGDV
jgi:CcmD family protein